MIKFRKKPGCQTPKYRTPIEPPKPKPSSINCTYITPCGWCTKWDKECNSKPYKRGLRVEINPIDDALI